MSWGDAARTDVPAITQGMTTERAGFTCDDIQALNSRFITRIDDQVQRAIQGHRTEITRVERHQRASRITGPAINALRLMIERLPLRALLGDGIKFIGIKIIAWNELRQRAL